MTADIPYGNLCELQRVGLLPRFQPVEAQLNTEIYWGGAGGERPEIGILPNDHAAFLGGQSELRQGILDVAYATEVPLKGLSVAHRPNAFWLPFLLTGDHVFVERLEQVHRRFVRPGHLTRSSAFNVPRRHAWCLRDLGQLAFLESRGMTSDEGYLAQLDEARSLCERVIAGDESAMQYSDPRWRSALHRFFLLGLNNGNGPQSWGWKPWQLAFQGMALAHLVRLGFRDWLPILEYQFQNCRMRSGGMWPLKACDTYEVNIHALMEFDSDNTQGNSLMQPEAYLEFALEKLTTVNWQTLRPYIGEDWNVFSELPDRKLVDPKLPRPSGGTFVHWSWAANQFAWAASAAQLGVTGARTTADRLLAALQARPGPRWYAKTAIAWRTIQTDSACEANEPPNAVPTEAYEGPSSPTVVPVPHAEAQTDAETRRSAILAVLNEIRGSSTAGPWSQLAGIVNSANWTAPAPQADDNDSPARYTPSRPADPVAAPVLAAGADDVEYPSAAWPSWRRAIEPGRVAEIPCASLLASLDPHLDPALAPQYPSVRQPWGEFEVAIFQSWSGGLMAPGGIFWIPLHGGHTNGAGNQPYRLDLMSERPEWVMVRPPSGSIAPGFLDARGNPINLDDGQEATGLYADGRIRAAHTKHFVWTPEGLWLSGHGGSYKTAVGGTDGIVIINEQSGEADFLGPPHDQGLKTGSSVYDAARNCVWSKAGKKNPLVRIDVATKRAEAVGPWWPTQNYGCIHHLAAHDVIVGWYRDPSYQMLVTFDCASETIREHVISGDMSALDETAQAKFAELAGDLWLWDNPREGNTLTRLRIPANPHEGPWSAERVAFPGAEVRTKPVYGTYGMFSAVPELGGFFLTTTTFENPVFFALS